MTFTMCINYPKDTCVFMLTFDNILSCQFFCWIDNHAFEIIIKRITIKHLKCLMVVLVQIHVVPIQGTMTSHHIESDIQAFEVFNYYFLHLLR
jgi:hypothetical protein